MWAVQQGDPSDVVGVFKIEGVQKEAAMQGEVAREERSLKNGRSLVMEVFVVQKGRAQENSFRRPVEAAHSRVGGNRAAFLRRHLVAGSIKPEGSVLKEAGSARRGVWSLGALPEFLVASENRPELRSRPRWRGCCRADAL